MISDPEMFALRRIVRELDLIVGRRGLGPLSECDIWAYERLGVEEKRLLAASAQGLDS